MRPEPAWHAEAREMRARGLTLPQIAARVGKHHTTVLYAVNPVYRERKRRKTHAYYHGARP